MYSPNPKVRIFADQALKSYVAIPGCLNWPHSHWYWIPVVHINRLGQRRADIPQHTVTLRQANTDGESPAHNSDEGNHIIINYSTNKDN